MLKLDGKTLLYDKAFTHGGISYPANWLRLTTLEEKQAIGISEVSNDTQNWDQRFYWNATTPRQLDDKTETIDGTEVTTTGLKTLWKAEQNQIAGTLLSPSDWRVVKAAEVTAYSVETKWLTYRAAVRTACNTRQTEINAVSTVDALKELLFGDAQIIKTKQQQQTDADGNGVVDSDGNPVMETVNDLDTDGNIVMIANPNLATAWPTPIE